MDEFREAVAKALEAELSMCPRITMRITHCLCSQRHYIAAIAWAEEDYTEAEAIEKLKTETRQAIEHDIVKPIRSLLAAALVLISSMKI